MNLDYRSVPYRIFENGLRIVSIFVFSALLSTGDGGGQPFDPLALAGLVLLGLVAIGGYELAYVRRYEYRITRDTFDITSGVISRREREIPFERVQNVDIAQNVAQRLLDIAEVRIETAGGGDSEARLRYVSRQEANRLQNLVSDRKSDERDREREPATDENVLFELDTNELAVLGATSANFRLLGYVALLLWVVGSPVAARQVAPRLSILLLLGPVFAVVALVVMWLASGVQAVLRHYGFRLVGHEEELRYRRGLLQQYNGTIPLSKVQTLMIRENVLARAVGYGNLVIETAGYAPGQGSDVESAVPIAKRDRLFALARTIEDTGEISFTRAPKRARTRYVARYTIVVAILVAVLGVAQFVTGDLPYWYLAGLSWLLTLPAAHLKWVHIGYSYGEEYVVARSGFWTRRTTIVPYYRVQTLSDSQTIFQRRRNLATLVVDTASSGGFWGGDATIPDIDCDTARTLREEVNDRFQQSIVDRRRRRIDDDRDVGPNAPGNPSTGGREYQPT